MPSPCLVYTFSCLLSCAKMNECWRYSRVSTSTYFKRKSSVLTDFEWLIRAETCDTVRQKILRRTEEWMHALFGGFHSLLWIMCLNVRKAHAVNCDGCVFVMYIKNIMLNVSYIIVIPAVILNILVSPAFVLTHSRPVPHPDTRHKAPYPNAASLDCVNQFSPKILQQNKRCIDRGSSGVVSD